MNWVVEFRPEVERDMVEAAAWYEARQAGLGSEFVEEVIRVWHALGGQSPAELSPAPNEEHPLALSGTVSLSRHLRDP